MQEETRARLRKAAASAAAEEASLRAQDPKAAAERELAVGEEEAVTLWRSLL